MVKRFLSLLLIAFTIFLNFSLSVQAYKIDAPHWSKTQIKVYIPQNNKAQTMRNAFTKWQSMSENKLNFEFVKRGPADIDVVFTDKVDGSDGPLGQYKITIKDGNITKGEIKIATNGQNNYSNDYIYTTMLHEIGHVLGLQEKERKNSSIMNMPITESQDILKRDIAELYYLYKWSYSQRRINN